MEDHALKIFKEMLKEIIRMTWEKDRFGSIQFIYSINDITNADIPIRNIGNSNPFLLIK